MTALDLIAAALRKLGVLAGGETPSADSASDGLIALNGMMEQYGIESLTIPTVTRTTWTITSGQGTYTIGESADNVLVNGDFEGRTYAPAGGTSTIPTGWYSSGPGTLGVVSSPVHTAGGSALEVDGSGGGGGTDTYAWQNVAASPDQEWSVTVWANRHGTTNKVVYIYDVTTGLYLQSAGTWSASRNQFLTDSGGATYTEVTGTFTTESTTERLQLQLQGHGIGGDAVYFDDASFGPINNIDIPRPSHSTAIRVAFQDTSLSTVSEIPLTLLTEEGWQGVIQKTNASNFPQYAFYNPTSPNGTLDIWPIPSSSTLEGVIYVPTPLTSFATLTTTLNLPPGYQRMLVSNLALELAPDYQIQPHPALIDQARDSKAAVRRSNLRLMDMSFDSGLATNSSGWFNPWTGS